MWIFNIIILCVLTVFRPVAYGQNYGSITTIIYSEIKQLIVIIDSDNGPALITSFVNL